MGVDLGREDIAYRLNLVTLFVGGGDVYMEDFSADHISTEEGRQILASLSDASSGDGFEFYPGFPIGIS